MATISPVSSTVADVAKVVWETITSADTADAFTVRGYAGNVAAVQVTGTFGGTTVTLQGSIDGTNYTTLVDLAGADISVTAAGLVNFQTAALYIKPVCTGGAAYDIDVSVILRGK